MSEIEHTDYGDDTDRALLHSLSSLFSVHLYNLGGMAATDNLMYEIDGNLNWFLFELHGAALRNRLLQRAAALTSVLRHVTTQHKDIDYIVAATLLCENRYAAALLYRHATCAFRDTVLRQPRVCVTLPLMVPLDQHGLYICKSLVLSGWTGGISAPMIQYSSRRQQPRHNNTNDTEDGMLYYEPLVAQSLPVEINGLTTRFHKSSARVTSCILACVRKGSSIQRISVFVVRTTRKDDAELLVQCCADDAWVCKDASGNQWFNVSLKRFTSNRDALTYAKEQTMQVDPPLDCAGLENNGLHLAIDVDWTDAVGEVYFYHRCFNVMRSAAGTDICGRLFI
jgi:hypothetical protein